MHFYKYLTASKKYDSIREQGYIRGFLGFLLIYSVLIPFMIIHLWLALYEAIYFRMYKIPRVRFKDYRVLDRGALKKLNSMQKIACLYCGYCNSLAAWIKDVVNMTELYSCSIKHATIKPGQEHQKDFWSYEQFT